MKKMLLIALLLASATLWAQQGSPRTAAEYNNRGNDYLDNGDYDRAIADYTQAIRLDPNDAWAYNNRGSAYYNKGDWDRAIADFTQAVRIDPNFANPYRHRDLPICKRVISPRPAPM